MKLKIFKIAIFLLCSSLVFGDSIITGFDLFYKLPYDEGLKQIKSDGFVILKESVRRDTNTDRKTIEVSSFEYDGLPYKNGIFSFDRDLDGKYYFTIAEGDVDTDKIDYDIEYAAKFKVFLDECKRKYTMKQGINSEMQLIGFNGDNGGYIILSITEKLHVAYFPKASLN